MIKTAIIGCGAMGRSHALSCKDSRLIEIVAYCDIDYAQAQLLASQMGGKAYDDVEKMLNNEDIDAVVIATPDHLHKDAFIACSKAKKAIMLEKPFATNLDDASKMMDAIKENNTIVQMAHLFRFLPFYINMKNAASNGELGEILSAYSISTNRIFVPTKMLKWAQNSSPSWFLMSHTIDALMWICDSYGYKVSARGIKKKLVSMGIDTYDIIKAELILKNDVICTLEANWIFPDSYPIMAGINMSITGSEGSICTNTADPIMQKATGDAYSIPGILEYDIGDYHVGLRRNMLEAFARSVEDKKPILASANDGFETLKVLCAIDESLNNDGKQIIIE